jgi:hypothetical protein
MESKRRHLTITFEKEPLGHDKLALRGHPTTRRVECPADFVLVTSVVESKEVVHFVEAVVEQSQPLEMIELVAA